MSYLILVLGTIPFYTLAYFLFEPSVRRSHVCNAHEPWINEWIERGYRRERFVLPLRVTLSTYVPGAVAIALVWILGGAP